ncbi:hypothetical protein GCM10027275_36250 [Rhabdobacter roseus]|uniref:Membrane-bound lytic murein transglycosylase D n=1 Tax=Rhabdobacter roseus TaxID=1655419 RepID=A0A840U0R3_9BACT|nr:LysM peptidoglycan-binding domain-containing protein [Rhabdobacter roseus]MBB5285968.1 membrane-bound lytic murein transglycosylase D [Rhabdobacter roseus]
MLKHVKNYLSLYLLVAWVVVGKENTAAQDIPSIPASLPFAGINVKLDNGARALIESDVRSLMANRRFWEDKMDRAILYFPLIEGVLIDEEVPIDFKYLAVQESSLTPDAVSSSNAVGFWQFKQETALELGIRVDNEVDERKNISASTHAAARYLKRSNQQFNNWVSSLYSYYLGMGGISKIVPANWAYAREITLTGQTDRYVLRFFAHKIALEAGLERYRSANTIVLLEAPYGKGRALSEVSRDLGVTVLDLQRYNRWFNGDYIPADKDYMLAIPVATGQINAVRDKLSMVRQDPGMDLSRTDIGFPVLRKASVQLRGANDPVFYEINGLPGVQARPNDQVAALAKIAKISTSSFLRYNDMTPQDPIIPGDVYYLAKKNKKAMVPFHTVRENETLRSISQIYGIRLRDLMSYNRINNRNLRLPTGRVMWLMKKRPAKQPVEIINQPGQDKNLPLQATSTLASAPATVAPASTPSSPSAEIPRNASERKKYTPKLAENTTASGTSTDVSRTDVPRTASPSNEAPAVAVTRTEVPRTEVPANEAPANETAQARVPTRTSTSGGSTGDRIVIISQENGQPQMQAEEPTAVASRPVNRTPSARVPATSTPSTSSRPAAPSSGTQYHTVEAGQTFYSVSRLYNISVYDLFTWNKLTADDKLSVGQRLLVAPPATQVPTTVSTTTAPTADFVTHTVASGETLFRISQTYGVSMDEIQQVNNMPNTTVKLGQRLKIPKR